MAATEGTFHSRWQWHAFTDQKRIPQNFARYVYQANPMNPVNSHRAAIFDLRPKRDKLLEILFDNLL